MGRRAPAAVYLRVIILLTLQGAGLFPGSTGATSLENRIQSEGTADNICS